MNTVTFTKSEQNSTSRTNSTHDFETIEKVWQNGTIMNGHDPNKYRQDECGAWIFKEKYGRKDSQYGWEIDKIDYKMNGHGGFENLRPVQWENKEGKINGKLTGIVKAVGPKNI